MLLQSTTHHSSGQSTSILLQSVPENLVDGVLILTLRGEFVYSNGAAREICQLMHPQGNFALTAQVWQVCQTLIECKDGCFQTGSVESEIAVEKEGSYRVRVQWLHLEDAQQPYLLVLLEDYRRSLHNRAIAEIQQFGLTPRQADVWLLHRLGYSYNDIATRLYISFNTVKKHIKDIHIKQQDSQ
jgi:DNA-binding CsgD family transcriptional regulator